MREGLAGPESRLFGGYAERSALWLATTTMMDKRHTKAFSRESCGQRANAPPTIRAAPIAYAEDGKKEGDPEWIPLEVVLMISTGGNLRSALCSAYL
jgi:hypothetical protein